MAARKPRTPLGINPSTISRDRLLLLLLFVTFAFCTTFASAACGVEFLFPPPGLVFYYLDTINVTYTSNFSDPSLFCFCGQNPPEQKYEIEAPAYNSSVLVLLNFQSSDPCWFDLRPMTGNCGDNSPHFTLLPESRGQSESKTTIGLLSSTTGATPSKTGSPSDHAPAEDELSSGAKAGIAVAVVGTSLAALGMASCFFYRRRKQLKESGLGGHVKKGLEKMGRGLSDGSDVSNASLQPLQGVQPVHDGSTGSTGYQDGPLGSSAYLYSPHSPSVSADGGYHWSERDELESARTKQELEEARRREEIRLHNAPAASSIVSYGPNPLTPVVSPRPGTRLDTPAPVSPLREHGYEEYSAPAAMKTHTPPPQRTATVQSYSHTPLEYYAPGAQSIPTVPQRLPAEYYPPENTPPPPLQQPTPETRAIPMIVSYGPNQITPTPSITPTTRSPPSNSPVAQNPQTEFPVMDFPSHPFPSHRSHDLDTTSLLPRDTPSLFAHDTPSLFAHNTPKPGLPPYASAADFYAMGKGAIRKLDSPRATAELPPTKDGYYQYGDRADEYELQGGETLRPHRAFGNRGLDEQKVLLGGEDLGMLREIKARKRAERGEEIEPVERGGGSRGFELV